MTPFIILTYNGILLDVGETEKLVKTVGFWTVRVKLVVPLDGLPETRIVYVTAAALASAEIVSVEMHVVFGVHEVGLNDAVTPVGKGPETRLADKVTASATAGLAVLVMVIVLVPLDPLTTASVLALLSRV